MRGLSKGKRNKTVGYIISYHLLYSVEGMSWEQDTRQTKINQENTSCWRCKSHDKREIKVQTELM